MSETTVSPPSSASARPSITVESAETVLASPGLDEPSLRVRDRIWQGIVACFCLSILALVGALIVAMFVRTTSDTVTGLVHGVLLLLVGYIAGLLQRGPHQS